MDSHRIFYLFGLISVLNSVLFQGGTLNFNSNVLCLDNLSSRSNSIINLNNDANTLAIFTGEINSSDNNKTGILNKNGTGFFILGEKGGFLLLFRCSF